MNDIFYQDDSSRLYYVMDFTGERSVTGDTITGMPTVTSYVRGGLDSDLIIENVAASGLYVGMYISGGTAHRTYKIEVLAHTQNGVTLEGDGFLRVGD